MNKYIPVFTFAKKNNTSVQNVYRWIRERKIQEADILTEEIKVKRIRINEETKLPWQEKTKK